MNRRRITIVLCTILPLFLMGCQTYTAAKGKAAIQPTASVAEEKTITKYSVLQEENEALLREEALQEQQEQAALVEQQQAERDKRIAFLTEREQELESSLTTLNSRLKEATKENQQLVDSLTELTMEKEEILLDTQLSSQESAQRIEQLNAQNAERIEELKQQNTKLANEMLELQSMIEENQTLQQEQITERLRLEQEQEALLSEQEKQRNSAWQELSDERDVLASENHVLRAQIEELKQQNTQLATDMSELKSLIKENQTLQQEQQAKMLRLEQEQEDLLSEQEGQRNVAYQELSDESDTLASENSMLKAQVEELKQQNVQLANEISELKSLIEENQTLQQEQEALLSEQEGQRNVAYRELSDERDALSSEVRMLKAQLEEKTLTIEEKIRLEQLRSDEIQRLEQERLAKRLEQEAKEKRIASQAEEKRLALEKEWRQIPPLDQITYPRLYKTEMPTSLAQEGETLRALMLPLDDVPWKDSKIVTEVHQSIQDLGVPIVFVTGHMENVIALVREMRSNAAIFSTGAIITSFPIQELSAFGAEIQYQEKKNLRLIVANLPEYQVVEAFARNGGWQATQKKLSESRLNQMKGIVGEGSLTVATLLGASLYEPSYRDWNTFSPVAYRQVDYLWPLSDFLENEGFYDTYRLTHFSEATNAGNTLITPTWSERVDFIYSRKILPLESAMLTIGGESAPDERGISRFGVLGTFLVP